MLCAAEPLLGRPGAPEQDRRVLERTAAGQEASAVDGKPLRPGVDRATAQPHCRRPVGIVPAAQRELRLRLVAEQRGTVGSRDPESLGHEESGLGGLE
jgi:hypothetical protein